MTNEQSIPRSFIKTAGSAQLLFAFCLHTSIIFAVGMPLFWPFLLWLATTVLATTTHLERPKTFTDSIFQLDKEFRIAREQVNFENKENLEEKKIEEIISYEISNITDGVEKIESLKMLKDLVANFDILQKDKVLTVIDEKVNSLREVENPPKNMFTNSEAKVIEQQYFVEDQKPPQKPIEVSMEVPRSMETRGQFGLKTLISSRGVLGFGGVVGGGGGGMRPGGVSHDANNLRKIKLDENVCSIDKKRITGGPSTSQYVTTPPKNSINTLIQPTQPAQEDETKKDLIPLIPTIDQDQDDEDVDVIPSSTTTTTTTTIAPTVGETTNELKKFIFKFCKWLFVDHPPLGQIKKTVVLPSSIKRKRETDEELCACDELEEFFFGAQ